MSNIFSPLLFLLLARCTENELRRQIEFLKAENQMLRQRVPRKRIFRKCDERERLVKLGSAIGPGVAKLITVVHPRTYQRWVMEKLGYGEAGLWRSWVMEKNAGKAAKKMGVSENAGVGSRVHCPTRQRDFKPDSKRMVRQAEAVLEQARAAGLPFTHLVRDRDGMCVREFDAVFARAGVSVEPTAPRALNQNAFIERWIKSIQVECLNHFTVFGQKHFDYLVACYLTFYNTVRPHQALDNRPLVGVWPEFDEPLVADEKIVCCESLGGVLRHYERVAA